MLNLSSLAIATEANANAGSTSLWVMVIYVALIGAFFYFMLIRPQKKEKKRTELMLSELAVGDTILTTSGFYGVIIDMTDDTIIVEFGNNKNCRIPMQKTAVVQSEKPQA